MARIAVAWELGGETGHVATVLPIAGALRDRGHEVRLLLRNPGAGADLDSGLPIPREGAPIWEGPAYTFQPRNFGEILHNFGYQSVPDLRMLIAAWRDKLAGVGAVVANVSPAAHLAARTLGIPSFEMSQGYHVPPPAMPSPPLNDWQAQPRAELEAADRRVLAAMNAVLGEHGAAPLDTIGALFEGRSMLLTYPELDIYSERGPAEYFGIPETGEGKATPEWPAVRGTRVLAYIYDQYELRLKLLDALAAQGMPTLALCRGADDALRARFAGGPIRIVEQSMAMSVVLPQAEMVICHGSHQTTALALLRGKPVLLMPTHLEQFLITRRVVRQGAGLGIAPELPDPDFGAALRELAGNPSYRRSAEAFAQRYAGHDRRAALTTLIARCEAALRP